MAILEEAKEAGLAQTGDNVQQGISYICNCCRCCCGMMEAIRHFDMRNAIVSSNWVAAVDPGACTGCGACVKACPVNAIALELDDTDGVRSTYAVCDETLCLGCGVCYGACRSGAIGLKPRGQRVHTPETFFDRTVAMAIERGKLAHLLFDEPESLTYRALGRIAAVIEKSPPYKAAMAIKPLRSAFLNRIVAAAKKQAGAMGDSIT